MTDESFNALHAEPSATNTALRLANDLTADELDASGVARNTLVLLLHAADGGGLKLTAVGNLARSVVAEMIDHFDWPDFDRADAFQFHKVINEPDFLPLHFVRLVAEAARLVRRYRGFLKPTVLGRDLSKEPQRRALLAILFHVAGWHCDLSYFGRGPHGAWPQRDIGVILWSTLRSRAGLGVSGDADEAVRDPDQRCPGRAVGQRINGDGGKNPKTAALVRPA